LAVGVVEMILAVTGAALVGVVMLTDQAWLDRHFVPSFFVPRPWYIGIEFAVRACLAVAGVAIVLSRARVARLLTRAPGSVLGVLIAAVLGVVASEVVLRAVRLRSTEWLVPEEEPRRQEDARLGWALAPDRVGRAVVGGRTLDYAIDAAGYRVRRLDEPVDVDRPTLVFAGESVMFGEGLTWDESIPAETGALLGIQSANLAVHGYSTDQMYLRLARELPHFREPVAVVAIFMTELFGRNLDDDRPHLTPGLVWNPAATSSRLKGLAKLLVPYRRDQTVETGAAMTRDVLRAIVQCANGRHAIPLVVIPQFGPEDDAQRAIRVRVITDDIPSLTVALNADWRLPWDRHPNARAAHAIASAVAERLRRH
jgi:hypothetical protein